MRAIAYPRSGSPFEVELVIEGPVRPGCQAHPPGSRDCVRCTRHELVAVTAGGARHDVGVAIERTDVERYAAGFVADGIAWPFS